MNEAYNYHGTAMLSLVTGKTLGVSKKVSPIVVRIPTVAVVDENGLTKNLGFTRETWITALSKVLDDLGVNSKQQASSVVLLAQHSPREKLFADGANPDGFIQRMRALLDEMNDRGAIVVTGAGESTM